MLVVPPLVTAVVFDDDPFVLSLLKNLNLSNIELFCLLVAPPGVDSDRADGLALSGAHWLVLVVAIRLTCLSAPTDWLRPLPRVLPPGVGMPEVALLLLLGEADRGMPLGTSRGFLPLTPVDKKIQRQTKMLTNQLLIVYFAY